tara:strand:+ start:777 stop:1322 length:546 start_codon:yes stop_codon:yes gene_type:complete
MINEYYNTLEVDKTATLDEIKKSYKSKVKEHHPDKGGNEDLFKKVQKAYDVLKDEQKRSLYDSGTILEDNVEEQIIDIFTDILLPEMVDNINSGASMLDIVLYYLTQEENKLKQNLSELIWSKDSITEIISYSDVNSKSKIGKKIIDNFTNKKNELTIQINKISNRISLIIESKKIAKKIF